MTMLQQWHNKEVHTTSNKMFWKGRAINPRKSDNSKLFS